MIINVGTQNPVKLDAVRHTVLLYPELFPDPEVIGVKVKVSEFGHPVGMQQVFAGAASRALLAYTDDCGFSIGLEGGLIVAPPPCSVSGHLETSVAAVFDGTNLYTGMGPCFEWPLEVTKMILSGEADASQAMQQLGYIKSHGKSGAEQGGNLGFLTGQRMTRETQIRESLIAALIYLERPEFR